MSKSNGTRVVLASTMSVALGLMLGPSSAAGQQAIVIDHTCTSLDQVPTSWIQQARNNLRVSYGHTSHGSQLISGISTLNQILGCSCASCSDAGCTSCLYGYCDDYYYYTYGGSNPVAPPGVLSLWDCKPVGASDLGNPNRTAWEAATRAMLNDPKYNNRNVVMWSWCGQVDGTEAEIQTYLNLMSGLIASYPNVKFVYMTGHLNGTGATGNVNVRNNQIRQHVAATGGILFDFADIESYDPDGNEFMSLMANDNCDYRIGGVTRNWANEWCAAHPGDPLCANCPSSTSCAHSKCLNCNLKGRAFWWMMARLAGWPGPGLAPKPADLDGDEDVDQDDYEIFATCATGPGVTPPGVGCDIADLDGDEDVDQSDFGLFQKCLSGEDIPAAAECRD